ncbi:ABC transporter substrate-binding protein [Streptomyces sp. TLI_146]|uniref:ABC transporter substrate-binding protein n=1 Tax=Streptomyces sp. TLI_146 TaxID=1938858 RepID=UPI000CBBFB5D|nr:ABC transporter substrate-binding protein [Streptomyces sp. TLI_146]PKV77034.1 iron complex transport system substrate-binding protein [Streptomyces sp. TLI_146]
MRSRVWWPTTAVVLGLLAAGCGDGDKDADKGKDAAAGAAVSAGGFPVSVTDCMGAKTTFAAAPKKIVTSNAAALELLLRLGAGDKVVGTGFPPGKGTLPADLDARAQQVKVLGKMVIPKEKLLGSGADLYIDTFASMGGMGGGGMGDAPTAAEFKAAGIKHVFLKSTACAADRKSPVTDLSAVQDDITSLGAVTGTSAKAGELVAGMTKTVDGVQAAVRSVPEASRPTYFFFDYDAGTKQPSVVCNRQVAHAVITLAGARNAFGDCDGDFKQVGWEDVIAKNPDWIQLGVRDRGSEAANKAAFDEAQKWLQDNAATKGLKAVKEGHFVRIGSERTTIAGVTNADTVREIAKTVHPGKVG